MIRILPAGFVAVWLAAHASADETLPRPSSPAPVETVTGEQVTFSSQPSLKWGGGTRLAHVQSDGPGKGLPTPHALEPASVVVRQGPRTLQPGIDFVVNGIYGTLSPGSAPSFDLKQPVQVDYRVGARRLDSVVRTATGKVELREGKPGLVLAPQPDLEPGEMRLGNYFLDYFIPPQAADYFPVTEAAAQAPTQTKARGLDGLIAKLQSGGPVKVVCWGDSVTAGSGTSGPDGHYTAVFEKGLRQLFPKALLTLQVIAVGGSQSRQWMHPDLYPHATQPAACRFERIVEAKPDLVTIEFLNDAWMNPAEVQKHYGEILSRLKELNTTVIVITPNFTMPEMMNATDLRTPETRPYVKGLLAFAAAQNLAVADASSRWAHLWKEGVPYTTMLQNGINHPDDAGQRFFAEELLKLF